MSTDLSVTVIVLNWNGKELTIKCIESLKKVNYSNINILVVDNGSTDDTLELKKKDFPKIVCIEEKKLGVSAARNTGISKVDKKSEWIAFLDSDDIWKNDYSSKYCTINNSQPS